MAYLFLSRFSSELSFHSGELSHNTSSLKDLVCRVIRVSDSALGVSVMVGTGACREGPNEKSFLAVE